MRSEQVIPCGEIYRGPVDVRIIIHIRRERNQFFYTIQHFMG